MQHNASERDATAQMVFEHIDEEVEAWLDYKGYTRKNIGSQWRQLFSIAKKTLLKDKYRIDWSAEVETTPSRTTN